MNRSLDASIGLGLGLGLALLIAACSSSTPNSPSTGQAGSGNSPLGAAGAATGASGAPATGASGAPATGVAGASSFAGSNSSAGSGPGPAAGGSPGVAGGAASDAGASSAAGTAGSLAGSPGAAGGGSQPPVTLPELVTSANGAFWKVGTLTPSTAGTVDVTADDNSAKQRWDGFGGTFNEAGWDALAVLSESDRKLALTYLFDAASGANFAYGRLPIGASDYSMKRYTLAETANDYTMASFSIEQDKKLLIPYIKAALAIKPNVHLWASPWTPPA